MQEPTRYPTEQEWLDWQDHPATKMVRSYLRLKQQELRRRWANGEFGDQTQFPTVVLNAGAIAANKTIGEVLGLEYEVVLQELRDERSDEY